MTQSQMNWCFRQKLAIEFEGSFVVSGLEYTWTPPHINSNGEEVAGKYEAEEWVRK
jgi:hypothetical protein